LFISVLSFALHAQNQYDYEAFYHRGFLVPHRSNMRHLPETAAQMLELRISKPTDGSSAWNHLYDLPSVDFSIRAFELGNRDVLGFGLGGAFIFSRPFYHKKRFSWNGEIGAGPGIVTKKMDYETNYKNVAIGSHLNIFFVIGTEIKYQIIDNWTLNASLSFNHFSNASVEVPNLGLNYPMAGLGFSYNPAYSKLIKPAEPSDTLSKISDHWQWSATLGFKQNNISRDVYFPALSGNFERVFGLNKKVSLATGVDIFNNTALLDVRKENGKKDDLLSNMQVGAHANYQLHVSDFVLLIGAGLYVIDSHKKDGILYNKAGFKYYPTKNWGLNVTLKTHKFKADFFEVGITHKF
jgi:hypothetical protein